MSTYHVTNVLLEEIVKKVSQRIDVAEATCMKSANSWAQSYFKYLINQNFGVFEKSIIVEDNEVKNQSVKSRPKVIYCQTVPQLQLIRKPTLSVQYNDRNKKNDTKRSKSAKKTKRNDRFIKLENLQNKMEEKKVKNLRFQKQISINMAQKQKEGFCSLFSKSFKSLSRIAQNKNLNEANTSEKVFINPVIVQHRIGIQRKTQSKSQYSIPKMIRLNSNSSICKSVEKNFSIPQLKLTIKKQLPNKDEHQSRKISIKTMQASTRRSEKQNVLNLKSVKNETKLIIDRERPCKYNYIHIVNKAKAKEIFPEINLNRFQSH